MKLRNLIIIFSFIILAAACNNNVKVENKYDDIIDIKNIPDSLNDWTPLFFSDKGSWLGFALPEESGNTVGSFTGPFLISEGNWLSRNLIEFNLEGDKIISKEISFKPGLLFQKLKTDGYELEGKLFFPSSDFVIIDYKFSNDKKLNHLFNTNTFKYEIGQKGHDLVIKTKDDSLFVKIVSDVKVEVNSNSIKVNSGKKNYSVSFVISLNKQFNFEPAQIKTFFELNRDRWGKYISKIESVKPEINGFDLVAFKSLTTLIINWRAGYKDLLHEGIFPSSNIYYFNGFWAWDSWKHAVAFSYFEPESAKNQIKSMFDYQNEKGMVADCIYQNKKFNNWLNTKPPLSTWAVWEIYEITRDTEFLTELYPKLKKYHYWWYKYRDSDENGFCEYGGTENKLVAAKWESGMDNAVRFDESKMLKNKSGEYSIDQESVDLNAYLIFEKKLLSKIAKEIKIDDDAQVYEKEYYKLKTKFNSYFFNKDLNTFTDKRLNQKFVNSVGPESWTPLFTALADSVKAASTVKYILDENYFNSFVPFPTLDVKNPKFTKDGYWRGPVWLDQAYFGIISLVNYGYKKEAKMMSEKILKNCDGLLTKGTTIRENYNPINGKGLEARNFSWSAAHLLMLYFNDSIN